MAMAMASSSSCYGTTTTTMMMMIQQQQQQRCSLGSASSSSSSSSFTAPDPPPQDSPKSSAASVTPIHSNSKQTSKLHKKQRPSILIRRPQEQDGLWRDGYIPSFPELGDKLQTFCESLQLDKALEILARMDEVGHTPSNKMYWSLLKACQKQKAMNEALSLHSHLGERAYEPENSVLAEFMVNVLVSCHAFEEALEVFDRLRIKTAFSWTALISGYVQEGNPKQALRLYDLMLEDGTQPDAYTFVSLLKACSQSVNLAKGKALHDHAWNNGFKANAFIGSNLIDMYSKCGSLMDAEDVFHALPWRCMVTWTVMMSAYVDHHQPRKALSIYRQMCEECLVTDERSFVIALQACCGLARNENEVVGISPTQKVEALEIGRGLHADARRKGFSSNAYICNSLLSMYERCGEISTAQNLFFGSSRGSLVLWNTMLSAYVEHDQPNKALRLYKLMHKEGQRPGERTFVAILQACSTYAENEEAIFVGKSLLKVRSFEMGSAVHVDARRKGFDTNEYVVSALLNMYGKCGNIPEAKKVFDQQPKQSPIAWNAMLSAYVAQGQSGEALKFYKEMQMEGVHHDDITLISLLQVSGQTASIHMCRETYMRIVMEGFDFRPLVAINLIYAFGKCASMPDAQGVFDALPLSNVSPWNALISGYVLIGHWEKIVYYFENMQHNGIRPDAGTFLSIITSCAKARLVEEGTRYFECMCKEYDIIPTVQHYAIMVKLFACAGEFMKAEDILLKMAPMKPNLSLWLYLLEGCAKYGNFELGKRAFDCAISLEPKGAEAYYLLSKTYSEAKLWDMADQVESFSLKVGAKRRHQVTWIEHTSGLHCFFEGDLSNPAHRALYDYLEELQRQLTAEGEIELADGLMSGIGTGVENDWSLCAHSQKLALAFGLLNRQRVIRLHTNTCICQHCHNIMDRISYMKQVEILVIDEDHCHHFRH